MLSSAGIASSSTSSGVNTGGGVPASSWKEHLLDEIPVAAEDVGDAVTCLLHTILFTRAPGPVRPSEATCQAFPNVTYALCAVGDVSRKVDHAVRNFEESVVLGGSLAAGSNYMMGSSSMMTPYGQPSVNSMGTSNVRGANSGYIAVTFFERKVKKALFGLMSNEEKSVFEKWIIPVTVTSSPAASQEERELCAGETEAALQNALLHILTAVQSIEHIPIAMYDFEITTFNNLEDAQFGKFSVVQCVAKRTRQLERLLYMLESTAVKFQQVKSPHSTTDSIVLSPTTRIQVQKRYAKMLFDFLEKEKSLQIFTLFADAIHIEGHDEELQQLLVQVEDEELLRERVDGIWSFLAVTSINEDITTVVRSCEGLWNDLLPQISSVATLINTMRGNPETPSWSKPAEDACSPVHPWPYRS